MLTIKRYGLLSSSIIYTLGGGAQKLIGLLLLPLFTRYLTPTDYGIVGLLTILPALLLPIFSLGLSTSIGICYFAKDCQRSRLNVIKSAKLILSFSAVTMMALSLLSIDLLTEFIVSNDAYKVHTLIAVATIFISILCIPFQLEQQFSGRPIEFSSISFIGALFAIFANILTVIFFDMGALGMLIGGFIGQLFTLLLLNIFSYLNLKKGGVVDIKVVRELIQHGLPMLPSFILLFIIQNWVRWPIEQTHGIHDVGLFSFGVNLGGAIGLFTSGFVSAWLPWALEKSEQWSKQRYLVAERFTQYFIFGSILVLFFFCTSRLALVILATPVYYDSWIIIGLTAASTFLISIFSLLLPPVYMAKKVHLVLLSQVVAAVITIVSCHLLLSLGIVAGALAVFCGSIGLLFSQLLINKFLISIDQIPINWLRITQITILIIGACLTSYFIDVDDFIFFIVQTIILFLVTSFIALIYFPKINNFFKKQKKVN